MKKTKTTINQAIGTVLGESKEPLTAAQVLEDIKKRRLYRFKATSPLDVVRTELRRRCMNVSLTNPRAERPFQEFKDGRYGLAKVRIQKPVVSGEKVAGTQLSKKMVAQFAKKFVKDKYKADALEVRLHGSRADGTYERGSDIDLAVIISETQMPVGYEKRAKNDTPKMAGHTLDIVLFDYIPSYLKTARRIDA